MTLTAPDPLEHHRFHLHPAYDTATRPMRVVVVEPLTDRITHFRLVRADGGPLTPYQPGSHLILTAGEHRNAYSLVEAGINPRSYGISVLRRGEGGGSDWLHEHLSVGDVVEVEGPRSMFPPVLDQRRALLVAGGIGVTPVLSHARALARTGGSAEIVYSYRPGAAAHLEDLRALAAAAGFAMYEATTVAETVAVLRDRFADQPLGAHAYACGPASMLDTYLEVATRSGWPEARVHLERFSAPEQDPGSPFTAVVASTGARLAVPPGVPLLAALLEAGVRVPNLCRQGVCGECRVPVRVVSGAVEHRDLVLSEAERAAGDSLLCCVSRGTDQTEIEVLL